MKFQDCWSAIEALLKKGLPWFSKIPVDLFEQFDIVPKLPKQISNKVDPFLWKIIVWVSNRSILICKYWVRLLSLLVSKNHFYYLQEVFKIHYFMLNLIYLLILNEVGTWDEAHCDILGYINCPVIVSLSRDIPQALKPPRLHFISL